MKVCSEWRRIYNAVILQKRRPKSDWRDQWGALERGWGLRWGSEDASELAGRCWEMRTLWGARSWKSFLGRVHALWCGWLTAGEGEKARGGQEWRTGRHIRCGRAFVAKCLGAWTSTNRHYEVGEEHKCFYLCFREDHSGVRSSVRKGRVLSTLSVSLLWLLSFFCTILHTLLCLCLPVSLSLSLSLSLCLSLSLSLSLTHTHTHTNTHTHIIRTSL